MLASPKAYSATLPTSPVATVEGIPPLVQVGGPLPVAPLILSMVIVKPMRPGGKGVPSSATLNATCCGSAQLKLPPVVMVAVVAVIT